MRGKHSNKMRENELGTNPRFDFLIRNGRKVARKHSLLVILAGFVFATFTHVGAAAAAPAVPGHYEIFFYKQGLNGFEAVTSLPVCTTSVCEELILNAHITEEGTGLPAQGGLVNFQYCSYKGVPPNDITQPDEAPLEACADGSARWKSLGGAAESQRFGRCFL